MKHFTPFSNSTAAATVKNSKTNLITKNWLVSMLLMVGLFGNNQAAKAQTTTNRFNDGYLTVFKVTSGSALANTGTAIVAEEYLPTGASQSTPNFSVSLPTTGAGRVVVSGTAGSAGAISRAENGGFIVIPGYNAAVGDANTTFTTNSTIRTINGAGTVGAGVQGGGTGPTTFYANGSNNLRGGITDDGTKFWGVGNGTGSSGTNGLQYGAYSSGVITSITNVSASQNLRVGKIINGEIYVSLTGSFGRIGANKPITSSSFTSLFTLNAGNTSAYGFDVSPDFLTVYITDDGGSKGIYRYTYSGTYNSGTQTYSGGTWSGGSLITSITGCTGIAVDWSGYTFNATSGNGAIIYYSNQTGTTGNLFRASDNGTSVFGSTTTLRTFTSANNSFRGLAFSPIKQTLIKGANTPAAGNITQGTSDAVLFQFNLAADEGNSTLKRLILNQGGTATIGAGNSISNFRLLEDLDNNGVASATEITNSIATGTVSVSNITFNATVSASNYISQGNTRNYLVIGNVSGSGSGTFIPSIQTTNTINTIAYTSNLVNAGGSLVTMGTGANAPTGNTLTITSTPTLTWTPTSNTTFAALFPAAGTQQTATISGVNLTGNITISAASPFEVFNGSSWVSSYVITASGTLSATNVPVRIIAGTAVGAVGPVNITASGGGATTVNFAASGNVSSSTLSWSPTTLTLANTNLALAGASSSSTLTGSGLNGSSTITVNAPNTNFEVSSDNSTWGPTASLTTTGSGTLNQLVYFRLSGVAFGAQSGNATANQASPLVTSNTLALSGTVNTPTLTQPAAITGLNYTGAGPSAWQTFTFSGSNLSPAGATITIASGNSNFEVSSNGSTVGTFTVNASAGTLGSTTVYVRLISGLANNTYTSATGVTISGGGATTINVSTTGVVSAPVPLYLNSFTGTGACPTQGNSPTVAANATGAALSRSTTPPAPVCVSTTDVFNSNTFNITNIINDNTYIQFSVTADLGYQLNLTSLSFFRQGSNTCPRQLEVRYSTDNFATSTSWGSAPNTPTSGTVITWDFPDFSTATNGIITFRFYPYGSVSSNNGTSAVGGTFRLDEVTLNGTVSPGAGCSSPDPVTSFVATNGISQSVLTWVNGACYDQILVVAKNGAFTAATPSGTVFTADPSFTGAGTAFDGGKVVYYATNPPTVTVTNLTNGTTYNFKAFARKGSTWSAFTAASATPVNSAYYWNGAAPGGTTAAGGTGTWGTTDAWVGFTNPGSPLTWADGNPAIFGGTAGVVTLDADRSLNSLAINTTGYTFTAPSATAVALNGPTNLAPNVVLNLGQVTATTGIRLGFGGNITGGTNSSINFNMNTTTSNNVRLDLVAPNATLSVPITVTAGANAVSYGNVAVSSNSTGVVLTSAATITNNTLYPTAVGATNFNSLTINSVISGSAPLMLGAGSFGGAGVTTLNAANTYTGETRFNAAVSGIIRNGINNALPPTTNVIHPYSTSNGGVWDLNSFNQTIASLSSLTGNGSITNQNAGTGTSTLTINGTSTDTFKLAITNGTTASVALTRAGSGTTVLKGINTYTGATLVTATGGLYLNGTSTNTSPITVDVDAVIGGGGSTAGTLSLTGSIDPINANGIGQVGTFTTGAQTWNDGAYYFVEIDDVTPAATSLRDKIVSTGVVNLGTGNIFIDLYGIGANFDQNAAYSWPIITGTSITGTPNITLFTSSFTSTPTFTGVFTIEINSPNVNLVYKPVLLKWNTNGNVGTETTEPSTFNNTNIGVTNLTLGAGITSAGNSNRFGGSGWFVSNPTTLAEAVTNSKFIEFIVTPNSNYSFTATGFSFYWGRSSTGPSSVTLRSSFDNFTSDLGTVTGLPASDGLFLNNIPITGLSSISTTTTFRLYGYGSTGSGGTGGFDQPNSPSIVNVWLNGTTFPTAPNPTNLSLSATSGTEAATTSITITATTTTPVVGNQTVNVAITGVLPADYTLSSTSITIPNGGTTGSVTFQIVNDLIYEGTETATVTISLPASTGLTLGTPTTASITITDNDPNIVISSPGVSLSNVGVPSQKNIVFNASLAITGFTASFSGLTVTTAGTYAIGNLPANAFKLWYNSTNSNFYDATNTLQLAAVNSVASLSNVVFSFSSVTLPIGTTNVWVTVDISGGAGNNLNIAATPNSNFTFASGTISGSVTAGGLQTFVASPTLTEVLVPQYIQGNGNGSLPGGGTSRVPYVYRAKISGLLNNTTYRYNVRVAGPNEAGNDPNSGAGNAIFVNGSAFTQQSSQNLTNAANYGTFTTNASGEYEGWFISEPTDNERFQTGTNVRFRIVLNDGGSGTTAYHRLTTTSSAKVLDFGNTSGDANQCTGLTGSGFGTAKNLVMLYDNTAGTGRPLSSAIVEVSGATYPGSYASFYPTGANTFGAIIPNLLGTGIQRVEERDLATGAPVGCARVDADGVWPSGANTVSPNGGIAPSLTPKVLTATDLAPLLPPAITTVNTTGPNSINLQWSAATGASTYYVQISTSSTFANCTPNCDVNVFSTPNLNENQGGLNNFSIYYYRVASVNSIGCGSAYSDVTTFVTQALTWNGLTSSDWNIASNWAPAVVPTVNLDAKIVVQPFSPKIFTGNNGNVKNLEFVPTTTLDIADGQFLNVKANWNADVSGNAVTGLGTVVFNGTVPQTLFGNSTFNNITVDNATGVSISTNGVTGTQTVNRIVRLSSGAFTTNNKLLLTSNLVTTGMISGTGTGTISGNVSSQRYMPGPQGYRYVSSPIADVSGQTTSDFDVSIVGTAGFVWDPLQAIPSPFPTCWYYNETIDSYYAQYGWVAAGNTPIVRARGYALITPGGHVATLVGQVNTGTLTSVDNISKVGIANGAGVNLIGNPYPSPISWNAFRTDAANAGLSLDPTVRRFTSTGTYYGQYNQYHGGTGIGIPSSVGNKIALGQAFFVTRTTAGSSIATFNNAMRVDDANTSFYEAETPAFDLLRMQLVGGAGADELVVYFNPEATNQFDQSFDVVKYLSETPGIPNIYTNIDTTKISINSLPSLTQDQVVPMGIVAKTAGNYQINVLDMAAIAPGAMLYLEDRNLNTFTNLRNVNNYNVTLPVGEHNGRFFLHFRPAVNVTVSNETCQQTDGAVTITNPSSEQQWTSTLVNANGQIVAQSANSTVTFNGLNDGNYILTLTDASGYSTEQPITIEAGEVVVTAISSNVNSHYFTTDLIEASVDQPVLGATYEWYLNGVLAGTGEQIALNVTEAGVYDLTLKLVGANCLFEVSKNFSVSQVNTVGIETAQSGSGFMIYPNPTRDVLNVQINQKLGFNKLSIVDASGRMVHSEILNGNQAQQTVQVNLNNLAAGLYQITLEGNGKRSTAKFSKTK